MLKKRILSIVLALTMLMVPGAYAAQPAKDDMHGVWVASVHNIDFPSGPKAPSAANSDHA